MERKSIDVTKKRKPSGAAVIRQDLTRALYQALFEEWSENGYTAISLERVAARAGAGKAAIYRRWPSKHEFAAEAVANVEFRLADFSDQNSLEADLSAYLLQARRALRHRLVSRVLPDLFTESICSPELALVVDRLSKARRRHGNLLLDRAVDRGELRADIDRDLALDLIPSALYWRMIIRGQRTRRVDVERLVAAVAAALRTL